MTETGSETRAGNAASSFAEDEPRRDAHEQLSLFVLSLIHISEPTRRVFISYAVFCFPSRSRKLPRKSSI